MRRRKIGTLFLAFLQILAAVWPASARGVAAAAVAPAGGRVSAAVKAGAGGFKPSFAPVLPGHSALPPARLLGPSFLSVSPSPGVALQAGAAVFTPILAPAQLGIVSPSPAVGLSLGAPAPDAPNTVPAPGVAAGLRALGKELAQARGSGGGRSAPILNKRFDAEGPRSGDGAAVFAGSALDGPAGGRKAPAAGGLTRPLPSVKELRLGTYNVLNLFEMVGKHVPDPDRPGRMLKVSERKPKEEWQLREQAKAILESTLDIVSVQEVENIRALEDFNARYLGGAYRSFLIEGNDERGIDVGFLIKKDLPLEVEQRSHKDETWSDPVMGGEERRLFSRDLPALIVRAPGRAKPLFILLGTHFKSKRDRPRDRESKILREAQIQRSAEIVERYRAEFGPDAAIMLAGDFNGDLNAEDSFAPLWSAGLSNGLDLGDRPVPPAERVTHTYHPRDGPMHASQMDGILVSKSLRVLVKRAEIYRYRDANGKIKPIPRSYEERSRNPSDHFPLLLTLEFQPLLPSGEGPSPSAASPLAEAAGETIAGRSFSDEPAPRGQEPLKAERRLAALGLAWSFLAIASMYIVMPVRSALLLTQYGPEVMPWVFMASAVFTGLAAWLYARASSLPRKKLLGGTLAVLAAGLAAWWLAAPLAAAHGAVAFAFSLWTDAFSIMSVTLFWTYANDRFKGESAKRWFGAFAAAGALGGMAGSAATKLWVASLGAAPLLLIGAASFAAILAVFFWMERIPELKSAPEAPAEPAVPAPGKAADPWSVGRAVAASPFLLALTALVFFERLVPDFSNYIFNAMAQQSYTTKEAMAAFLANFGFWQNLASLISGALLTRWVLKRLGVGKALLSAPLANLLGFAAFALSPMLGVAVLFNGIEGWQRYGWFKAAKETTYTVADRSVIYQVKAYVEMFVYRFARGVAGILLLLLTGSAFLGWGPAAVAWAGLPLAAAWAWAAWRLGREFKRRESPAGALTS